MLGQHPQELLLLMFSVLVEAVVVVELTIWVLVEVAVRLFMLTMYQ
jgi:hypothetical protein